MKKLFTTMLTVLASGAAFALPVGNPSEASLLCDGVCWEGHCGDVCDPCLSWCDAFSVRLGFYGDYVFNRHMEVDDQNCDANSDYEHVRLYTNAAYLAGNFWDRVDIFITLGASGLYADGEGSAFSYNPRATFLGSWVELETETAFSWSVGGRATLWECGCTSVGIEGQYFEFRPHVNTVNTFNNATAGVNGLTFPANCVSAKYYEYQVGLGLSHRIHCFVPYVAVKWSAAKLMMDNARVGGIDNTAGTFEVLGNAQLTNVWGYAVGVSVVDCEKAAITGEFRGGDELAAYVNGQLRF